MHQVHLLVWPQGGAGAYSQTGVNTLAHAHIPRKHTYTRVHVQAHHAYTHTTHKCTHVCLYLMSSLTMMGMSSSFFTRAGESRLATRMPRGFAGWTDGDVCQLSHSQAWTPAHRQSPLPSRSWERRGDGSLSLGRRRGAPSASPPPLTHGANHVGRGSLVLGEPQGSQLGWREDDQGLGQGTEALPTHEEGKWVLDFVDHEGHGSEHAPSKVEPRTHDGLQGWGWSAAWPGPDSPPSTRPLSCHPSGSAWRPPERKQWLLSPPSRTCPIRELPLVWGLTHCPAEPNRIQNPDGHHAGRDGCH